MNQAPDGPRITDTWQEGGAYDRYIGRWSFRIAPLFLSWLAIPSGRRWLDVGCGTGALCAAILRHANPSTLTGVEPSEGFLSLARQHLPRSVRLLAGNAESIPLQDAEVDAVVSGLVLNFVPDLPRALAEMARVASPGGSVAAYVWDYAEGMEMLRHFWDAAVQLDPGAEKLHEGTRFGLCRRGALQSAFEQAGFDHVLIAPLDIDTPFSSFDDYWQPFLGAQGPAPAYVASLPEERRMRLREALRARVPAASDGTIALRARAWAVRGTAPKP
ncbi:SAM-dependent methyltransferase [Ramlibacter henchirensis]|uniref:SAM-dependent methyltransferase n=1 Tax=Ramlibacter henchirensis TaxID=204072 RepID=A0A4Z0C6X1_9BURK|nr:class I SAM-dependent methyltransferase [Ramlibacter henchirensis]TFZ06128.1 SAM-dependent methyltransferase [Ramlibacter henchirensis]